MARVRRSRAVPRMPGRKTRGSAEPIPESRFRKYREGLHQIMLKLKCDKFCEIVTEFLKEAFHLSTFFGRYAFWIGGACFCLVSMLSSWCVDSEGYEYGVYYRCAPLKSGEEERECVDFADLDLHMASVEAMMPLATLMGTVGTACAFAISHDDTHRPTRRIVAFPLFAAGGLIYEATAQFDNCMKERVKVVEGLTFSYTYDFYFVNLAMILWILNSICLFMSSFL